MATVFAEITFLSAAEGGRNSPPSQPTGEPGHGGYMPHAVVDGSVAGSHNEYLGVKFLHGPTPEIGRPGIFELELMYSAVDYSGLIPGVTIAIREGNKIVARGRIISRQE